MKNTIAPNTTMKMPMILYSACRKASAPAAILPPIVIRDWVRLFYLDVLILDLMTGGLVVRYNVDIQDILCTEV